MYVCTDAFGIMNNYDNDYEDNNNNSVDPDLQKNLRKSPKFSLSSLQVRPKLILSYEVNIS